MGRLVLAVFTIGLSGIAGQTLILRELLSGFCGNELSLGIIIAVWVLSEAAGAFFGGRAADSLGRAIRLLIALSALFAFSLPAALFFARTFKPALGISVGEGIGLPQIFLVSSLAVFLPGFSHGASFSAAVKAGRSLGKVYIWETLGTIAGGIALTYLLIPLLGLFQIAFLVSCALLAACLLLPGKKALAFRYLIATAIIIAPFSWLSKGIAALESGSIQRRFPGARVLAYRNSLYADIAVAEKLNQRTFFYNGLPVITLPVADIAFSEDFGHLPLLFHPLPKQALVIGAGAGGLLSEALKHPLEGLDYVELDPALIDLLKLYSAGFTSAEFSDKRVKVINADARFYLRENKRKYDLILIGLPAPASISANRFFTREFFRLAKRSLDKEGFICLRLPGSLAYLSEEMKNLNRCIIAALEDNFRHIRVIPGDYHLLIASDSPAISLADAATLYLRFSQRNIRARVINKDYLGLRLDPRQAERYLKKMAGVSSGANSDNRPCAVFEALKTWNKAFSPLGYAVLKRLCRVTFKVTALAIALLTLAVAFASRLFPRKDTAVTYAIFTSGFFAMLSSLLLGFAFQAACGYLFRQIGALISIFMAGIAAGGIVITAALPKLRRGFLVFTALEGAMLLFSLYLAYGFSRGLAAANFFYYAVLSFVAGALAGLQFPLAGKLCRAQGGRMGSAAGALYAADLCGGCVAALLSGIFLVPVLGLAGAGLVMGLMKASSLFILALCDPGS
jgi:spermidine synthase